MAYQVFSSPQRPSSPIMIPESPEQVPIRPKNDSSRYFDDIEDEETLGSPLSRSPFFTTQPTQIIDHPSRINRLTQPTQMADHPPRRNLNPQPRLWHPPPASSSPRSSAVTDIEVPASSPFRNPPTRPKPEGGRLAGLMAPAGTVFRAPAAGGPPPKAGVKRTRELVVISDDELDTPLYRKDSSDAEDGGKPSRGDIRPSSFTKRLDQGAAPKKNAFDMLKRGASSASSAPAVNKSAKASHPPKEKAGRKTIVLSDSDSDADLPSLRNPKPKPKETPQPARRRLVKGRRFADSSPPSKQASQTLPSSPAPVRTIEISDNDNDQDDDDAWAKPKRGERGSSPEDDDEEDSPAVDVRILQYLNTCDVVQLTAMTNIKRDNAEAMIKKRPFRDLESAANVTVAAPKSQGKKAARLSIGDEIVSALREYTQALDGIDQVISICKTRGIEIKEATSGWSLDRAGQPRASKNQQGSSTPTSLKELSAPPLSQPELMSTNCQMKPFQIYGLNWLWVLYKRKTGCILADDMGLGKTCQVISFICTLVQDYASKNADEQEAEQCPWPNLIMVPPTTLANWENEFKKFAPSLLITTYRGSQHERDEIAADVRVNPDDHHVVLASYSQVSRQEDILNLRRIKPMAAIFDEGHSLKNPKKKLYVDLLRISATWRLILSGTPVQNNLMEMIALLRFVEPRIFLEHLEHLEALFSQKVSLAAVSQGALLQTERVARARTILEPFILQRKKEQVLKDLPPKTARMHLCALEGEQRVIYRELERRFLKIDTVDTASTAKSRGGGRLNDLNNVWMQLRKAAVHPLLFRRTFADDTVEKMAGILMRTVPESELRQSSLEHLTNELKALSDFELHLWCRDYACIRKFDLPDGEWTKCGKVQELIKLVRGYRANGDRALVFTRFAKVIEILSESLASEGIDHRALQGNTEVKARQELVNEFYEDEDITVFLLTTGAGGTGINLTAANKVIIFDQSDNPQDDQQAEGRAHRLGQTRAVEVVRLITKDTIEELVYKACEKKLELARKVVDGPAGLAAMQSLEMTEKEMEAAVREEMLRRGPITPPESD